MALSIRFQFRALPVLVGGGLDAEAMLYMLKMVTKSDTRKDAQAGVLRLIIAIVAVYSERLTDLKPSVQACHEGTPRNTGLQEILRLCGEE